MSREKKPQRAKRASGSERSSSRGASKRPASSSQSSSKKVSPARTSRVRTKEDQNARKRRSTEKAVRKASARASQRGSSQSQSEQRTSSKQRTAASRKRTNSPVSQRSRNTSARSQGASVRRAQGSPQRKRPVQGASVRKGQPVKKRKPTAAEIARRKRNRRLILIAIVLLLFLIAGLFTLHYVSNRIQDQTDAAIVDDSRSFSPVACTPDILTASMSVNAPVEENSPITFTIALHNTSSGHPCYIDVGRAHTELTITSGDDSIASLSTCTDSGKENKQLLLDRNMKTSFSVTWNRHRDRGCSADAPTALPGMYKAVWTAKGEDSLSTEGAFEIEKPPEPEPTPEESEGENQDASPAEPPAEEQPANQ